MQGITMIEYTYDGSLGGLFAILEKVYDGAPAPVHVRKVLPARIRQDRPTPSSIQPDLFGGGPEAAPGTATSPGDPSRAAAPWDPTPDTPAGRELYELSPTAYDSFISGWLSEFPIEAELIHFAWYVLTAARNVAGDPTSPQHREAAETAASDRGNPAVQTVLAAAYKVEKEIDRLRGFLRFSPNTAGVYIARCAPNHFVLPALGGHFTLRFGETPWAIFDERRSLALIRSPGEEARIMPVKDLPQGDPGMPNDSKDPSGPVDPWEDLWRNYHRSINNESRNNPQLQRQFMPNRYRKYLPELRE